VGRTRAPGPTSVSVTQSQHGSRTTTARIVVIAEEEIVIPLDKNVEESQ
jgi:hypothetical protein